MGGQQTGKHGHILLLERVTVQRQGLSHRWFIPSGTRKRCGNVDKVVFSGEENNKPVFGTIKIFLYIGII